MGDTLMQEKVIDALNRLAYPRLGHFHYEGNIYENALKVIHSLKEEQKKDNEDFDKFARSISDIRMKNGNKIATFKDLQDYIELQVKQGSKEMAEKFAERLKERLKVYLDDDLEFLMKWCECQIVIDEICKEITEEGKK